MIHVDTQQRDSQQQLRLINPFLFANPTDPHSNHVEIIALCRCSILSLLPVSIAQLKDRERGSFFTSYFGYKGHIAVDRDTGLVRKIETTAANVHDVTQVAGLMDGTEEELYGDSGYLGAEKREEVILTNDQGKEILYIICARPSSLKKRYAGAEYEKAVAAEHAKASMRCKVEHVFAVVKGMFRFRKTRLRGLTKVNAQLHMLFALANLILAARPSLAV